MTNSEQDDQGPLFGFRIVDLSQVLSGPAAMMLLADQGVEVIKVEPSHGDITRNLGVGGDGMSTFYFNTNRGKRGISLDIKTPGGSEVVRRLIKTADVLVQNFRPGVLEKLGFGFDAVRAIRDDIIYVSISGFGTQGSYAAKRVYDPVVQALSGLTEIQAEAGRPRIMRTVIPDKTTALTTAQAITAALLGRTRTRSARHVEIAMLDATIAYLWPEAMSNQTVIDDTQEVQFGQPIQELIFKTRDGYITTGAMSDKEWQSLCQALEKPEWIDDPRFKTTELRFSNAQVVDNDIIQEYEHPGLGRVRQPRSAAKFRGLREAEKPLAPLLGQHNAEVLLELGYTQAEVDRFADTDVISR